MIYQILKLFERSYSITAKLLQFKDLLERFTFTTFLWYLEQQNI